jgi:hypothetical protein
MPAELFIGLADHPLPQLGIGDCAGVYKKISVIRIRNDDLRRDLIQYLFVKAIMPDQFL